VLTLIKSLLLLLVLASPARADKPAKFPVAFGAWKGPHAGTFKSALRRGLAKGCAVVARGKARALIEGEVTDNNGKLSVRVVVKSPRTDEIVESREYAFAKPNVSAGMSSKMGREVTEMVSRAPE
jgi:hypothetical protein